MSVTLHVIAAIFNEWAERYAKDPASFSEDFITDGKPDMDYGERCANYFVRLAGEKLVDDLLLKAVPPATPPTPPRS